jgi:hypothetical protein
MAVSKHRLIRIEIKESHSKPESNLRSWLGSFSGNLALANYTMARTSSSRPIARKVVRDKLQFKHALWVNGMYGKEGKNENI